MTGPIDTGADPSGRTDLGTLPVETSEAGVDHSHLHRVRSGAQAGRPSFLFASLGAAPQPFANLVLPLTKGAVQLADARGFAGIAFDARGSDRYTLLLDSYGLEGRSAFRASFTAGETKRELRIPFSTFRSPDGEAVLDLARLRALIVRLEGTPGGRAWLELGNVRFYR
jgi:hypothetical protein